MIKVASNETYIIKNIFLLTKAQHFTTLKKKNL